MLVLAALALLLGGGWMWLRDSSLAEVREVRVTGSSSSEEARIRAALDAAARDMTTLHVREERAALRRRAVRSVAGLRVHTDFPHKLHIEVIEHIPVAALEIGDRRLAAAGSGLVLRGVVADEDLPVIRMDVAPAGDRVGNANTLTALSDLRRRARPSCASASTALDRPEGHDARARRRARPDLRRQRRSSRRKWLAAARVLADPSSAGATYLDVRIPERVAAGGLGPVPEPTPPDSDPPLRQTLNRRVRMRQLSTHARDFRRSATSLAEVRRF